MVIFFSLIFQSLDSQFSSIDSSSLNASGNTVIFSFFFFLRFLNYSPSVFYSGCSIGLISGTSNFSVFLSLFRSSAGIKPIIVLPLSLFNILVNNDFDFSRISREPSFMKLTKIVVSLSSYFSKNFGRNTTFSMTLMIAILIGTAREV